MPKIMPWDMARLRADRQIKSLLGKYLHKAKFIKTKQMNILQIETEYDQKIGQHLPNIEMNKKAVEYIKTFYRSKITELLESTRLEEPEQVDIPEWHYGYTKAISDQDKKINEAIN